MSVKSQSENELEQHIIIVKKLAALLILLFLFTVIIFVYGLHKIKLSTEQSLMENLVLIEKTRQSSNKIAAYLEKEHNNKSKDNKHVERINALLIEHDKKLNILQEYTNQLYGIQQSYAYVP